MGLARRVAAQEYLAGYLIEESLSIDNLFVFLIVFGSLGIALRYQRKVLFWGIFGAIVMRGTFIFAGVSVLERFEWVMYLFGALLVFTAFRLIRSHGVQVDPERNPLVRVARALVPHRRRLRGQRLHGAKGRPAAAHAAGDRPGGGRIRRPGVRRRLGACGARGHGRAFVAFTSNVAAILGLRALYFALAGSLQRFEYLSWGLAIVLGFVGAKMLLSHVVHIPIYVSLGVIVVAVGGAVLVSLWRTRGASPEAEA